MNKTTVAIGIVLGLIALLVIGIVAGRVGGIAIRKQGAERDITAIQVSQPVVRGVPVTVRWDVVADDRIDEPIVLLVREERGEYVVGQARLRDEQAQVLFPCDGETLLGSLILRQADSQAVLASQALELAAPGPECVF